MRIGMLTVRRRSLLAGAAAGLLCGCQSTGTQFATPGVARGDMMLGSPGQVVTSPAFAQIAAGQQIAARMPTPAAGQPMMMSAVPTYTGQPVIVGPPVMGSGGLVYPVAYVPASQLPAGTPTMMTSSSMAAVPQAMPANTVVQSQPVMLSSVPVMPAAGTTGQPVITVVNGPNGPQYVITTEVMGSAPPAPPAASAPVVTVPAAPAPVPAPPAPEVSTPAPIVEPSGDAPTFTAPPPASVPMPPIPPAPTPLPAGSSAGEPAAPKTPASLPPTVGVKPPNGPVLPAAHAAPPSLGSFPPVPTTTPPATAPKLPPPTGVADEEIPAAPVFIPAPR
jgi:hypothetical protein